jgi:hypothetical protein
MAIGVDTNVAAKTRAGSKPKTTPMAAIKQEKRTKTTIQKINDRLEFLRLSDPMSAPQRVPYGWLEK